MGEILEFIGLVAILGTFALQTWALLQEDRNTGYDELTHLGRITFVIIYVIIIILVTLVIKEQIAKYY